VVLRKEIHRLGWKNNFTIYDEQDRIHAIKESARDLGLVVADLDAAKVADAFSKGETAAYSTLYAEYRRTLKIYNAVDLMTL